MEWASLPRGSRGPGYEVARDVSRGNPRLRALGKYLYPAPGILRSRGVIRKTRKCDTVPFPGSGDVAARTVRCVPMGEVSTGMIVLYTRWASAAPDSRVVSCEYVSGRSIE